MELNQITTKLTELAKKIETTQLTQVNRLEWVKELQEIRQEVKERDHILIELLHGRST